jgi:hypothetical protein
MHGLVLVYVDLERILACSRQRAAKAEENGLQKCRPNVTLTVRGVT